MADEVTPLLTEWLTKYNSAEPIQNAAIVQVLFAQQMGEYLNQLTIDYRRITDRIKQINDLMNEVRARKQTTANDASYVFDANADTANRIFDAMLAVSPNIFEKSGRANPSSVKTTDIDAWLNNLKTVADNYSSQSSQEQTRLQNVVGKITSGYDTASSEVKKLSDAKGNISNNLK